MVEKGENIFRTRSRRDSKRLVIERPRETSGKRSPLSIYLAAWQQLRKIALSLVPSSSGVSDEAGDRLNGICLRVVSSSPFLRKGTNDNANQPPRSTGEECLAHYSALRAPPVNRLTILLGPYIIRLCLLGPFSCMAENRRTNLGPLSSRGPFYPTNFLMTRSTNERMIDESNLDRTRDESRESSSSRVEEISDGI